MTTTNGIRSLRQRMIEDMAARNLGPAASAITSAVASALRRGSAARPTLPPPTM